MPWGSHLVLGRSSQWSRCHVTSTRTGATGLMDRCTLATHCWESGPWFNIKMTSYQYRKFHCGDKTVIRSSYLHNGISYTGKTTSLYWIRAQGFEHLTSFAKFYTTVVTLHIPHGISNHQQLDCFVQQHVQDTYINDKIWDVFHDACKLTLCQHLPLCLAAWRCIYIYIYIYELGYNFITW